MQEPEIYNIDNAENSGQKSVSVELTEADFLNPILRTEAIAKLDGGLGICKKRELVRPRISATRAILNVSIPLSVSAALFCIFFFSVPIYRLSISLGVSLGGLALYTTIRLRSIMIWFILLYQRFAPAETRLRCVFVPSCSEYAILALKRYGVIRGIPKIISRLKRCHPPNGGSDPLK